MGGACRVLCGIHHGEAGFGSSSSSPTNVPPEENAEEDVPLRAFHLRGASSQDHNPYGMLESIMPVRKDGAQVR
jgi:hypothetical protein